MRGLLVQCRVIALQGGDGGRGRGYRSMYEIPQGPILNYGIIEQGRGFLDIF
jgi:hypothetical protein